MVPVLVTGGPDGSDPVEAYPIVTGRFGLGEGALAELLMMAYCRNIDQSDQEIEDFRTAAALSAKLAIEGADALERALEALAARQLLPCLPRKVRDQHGIRLSIAAGAGSRPVAETDDSEHFAAQRRN